MRVEGILIRCLNLALLVVLLGATTAVAQSSDSQQQKIPTGSGNAVKFGDILIWEVNKPVEIKGAEKAPAVTQALIDKALAAAALQTAAHAAVEKAADAAYGSKAPSSGKEQAGAVAALQAAIAAAAQADTDAVKAQAAATEKGQAAQSTITAAQSAANDAAAEALKAQQAAATAAVECAGAQAAADAKGDKDAGLNKKASDAKDDAAKKSQEAAVAVAYWQAAKASLDAVTAQAAKNASTMYCFPANSLFQVTSVVQSASKTSATSASSDASNKSSTSAAQTGSAGNSGSGQMYTVSGHFPENTGLHWFHKNTELKEFWNDKTAGKETPCGEAAPHMPALKQTYDFDAQTLSKQDAFREGFTWGGLVIPFKFYTKSHSVKSNASVVGFAGYEGWFPGVSLSAVAALGLGTAQSSTTSSGGNTGSGGSTSTLATYTAAVGVILAFGDGGTTKLGLMTGRDYQGNPATFAYENKQWISLSIGAGF